MAKINRKDVYPDDVVITMLDFLLGSNADNSGKTMSYPVQGLADLIMNYVQDNVSGMDQDNLFRFIDVPSYIITTQTVGQSINENLIIDGINAFLQNFNLTVTEKQLIIFKFKIAVEVYNEDEEIIFKYIQNRKYYFPLGKGTYEPVFNSIEADKLEIDFIDETPVIPTPEEIENGVNNVIFDLGDITGEDYLEYINTATNPEYPNGYPLDDNTKIYYFKWIDDGVTYLYYFDEPNSANSYGFYGVDGDFVFNLGELILFYQSSEEEAPIDLGIYQTKAEKSDSILSLGSSFEYIPATEGSYARILSLDSGLLKAVHINIWNTNAYPGKEYTIKNETSAPLTIKHQDATLVGSTYKKFWINQAGTDLVLQQGESATFHYSQGRFNLLNTSKLSAKRTAVLTYSLANLIITPADNFRQAAQTDNVWGISLTGITLTGDNLSLYGGNHLVAPFNCKVKKVVVSFQNNNGLNTALEVLIHTHIYPASSPKVIMDKVVVVLEGAQTSTSYSGSDIADYQIDEGRPISMLLKNNNVSNNTIRSYKCLIFIEEV